MSSKIEQAFGAVPAAELLAIAKRVQREIAGNPQLVSSKEKGQTVTQADFQMQTLLLDYFAASPLRDLYWVKAEEALSDRELRGNTGDKPLQLLIDPLDGTGAFSKGLETWGTMIGLCDVEGRLIYSWNLLSTGEVFSTGTARSNSATANWKNAIERQGHFKIDVYDYGAGLKKQFPDTLVRMSGGKYSEAQVQAASFAAAVWTGAELYEGRIQGLLWLPSAQGKGNYPDYDLVFLGALQAQGWRIAHGKADRGIAQVVVAAEDDELELLWDIGMTLGNSDVKHELTRHDDLILTGALAGGNDA